MRARHNDRGEKGRAACNWRNRCAKQIHAGVAVVSVQRGDGAAKLTERSARIVHTPNDEASVRGAFAAGRRIFRRRDQRDRVFETGHIGIAAGLTEDEAWMSPKLSKVAVSGETRRRLNASVVEPDA